ncbi:MAG: precorrin-8X methylmutase [Nitrospirae bacterium]|nr:precorrin-8X methylmutase [Nitrospirota bacterium]
MEDARRRYSKIEFILTEPLGVHKNIAKVVLERAKKDIKGVKILKPCEIENKSFAIITEEMEKVNFKKAELPVVKRVVHATGDFDFSKNMRFHSDAVKAGVKAIRKGKDILVDVRMAEAGINKRLLGKWGGKVICKIQESGVRSQESGGKTRTESGIEKALAKNKNIGIIAIGNAPTALYRVMKLIRDEKFMPELVIGVPVGFVKAQESKEVLLHMKYPFITSLGRKGGSPAAAAIVNALLKIAEKGGDKQKNKHEVKKCKSKNPRE